MKVYGLLLFGTIFSSALTESQVPRIIRIDPLVVSYGRTLELDPERHLKIVVPESSRCKVTVVHNDPLTERTGYLRPDRFPCNFVRGEVQYVHLGSRAPSKDFVKLNVRVDTAIETLLRHVVLDITVDFLPMQIVTKNTGLIVSDPGGISSPIDTKVLRLKYNAKLEACRIILLDSEKGLPRYGRLINVSRSVDRFVQPIGIDCAEFLKADVRYEHTRGSNSPNRDYIPMLVEIHRSGELRNSKEYFQVAVRILGATPNQRPVPSFMSSKFMAVDQFVTKLITPDVLDAEDAETYVDYLIFNVTHPLGTGEGSIITTDDPHKSITSFYRKDLKDLKIAYRPPMTMSSKSRMYQVVFEAIDTEASHSEPIIVLIMVRPRNTLSPTVIKNKELQLFEGQSRYITSKDNLQISDKDNIENVKIEVVGGLRHGELYVKGKLARTFTPSDLDNKTIIYQHDDSDTDSDNIILNATDGHYFVEFAFIVNIIPVDDEHPVLVHNTGLELDKNSMAIIDEFSLRATDIDSDTNKIEFLVLGNQMQQSYLNGQTHKPGLQAGRLVLRQKEQPIDPKNWILQPDSFYEKNNVHSFTQEDIFLRRLFYIHGGAEIFEDRFHFLLADKAEKPNTSGVKTFHITINQVDTKYPEVHPSCSMHVDIRSSFPVKLGSEILWFTDADSDDHKLLYKIAEAPHFVHDPNKTKDAGSIVLSEEPNRILSNFTQLQLLHHKVSYKPPLEFDRFVDQVVQVRFSVSDPVGHIVENQIFTITLLADHSQMPDIKITKLQVNDLGMLRLTPGHFLTHSKISHHQQFYIVSPPTHGKLYKNGKQLDIGGTFTFKDILRHRLLYTQDGFDAKTDEIKIKLNSGEDTTIFQIQAGNFFSLIY